MILWGAVCLLPGHLTAVVVVAVVVGLFVWGRLHTRRRLAQLRAFATEVEGTVRPGSPWNGLGMQLDGRSGGHALRVYMTQDGKHFTYAHELDVTNVVGCPTVRKVDVPTLADLPAWLLGRDVASYQVHGVSEPGKRLFQATGARDVLARLLAVPGVEEIQLQPARIRVLGSHIDAEPAALRTLFGALVELARLCERRAVVVRRGGAERPSFAWTGGAEATRCPYCHDELAEDGPGAEPCERCATLHHADCLREAGGCTVLGCRPVPRAAEKAT